MKTKRCPAAAIPYGTVLPSDIIPRQKFRRRKPHWTKPVLIMKRMEDGSAATLLSGVCWMYRTIRHFLWLTDAWTVYRIILNTSFIDMAFTEEEQQAIIRSDVANASNYYFDTACGSGTHDQVFILSEEEVFSSENAVRYGFQPSDAIGDYGRRMVPTDFAVARGAWQSETEETAGIGFWLLRTNGYTEDNVVYVGEKGYLYNRGIPVTCDDAGIVPAIRIRLGAASVTKEADISTQSVKY